MTTATRKLYCQRCGHAAAFVAASLDPERPIVRCAYVSRWRDDAGCGRQVGTYSRRDAETAAEHRRMDGIARRHHFHVKDENVRPDCRHCVAEPRVVHRADHDYMPAATRLSVIAHLEAKHYRGAIPHDYEGVDMDTITAHHRSLHS